MSDAGLSYYIYYRVDAARADAARLRIDALQAGLHARCGVRGRCMRKRGEPLLWMEIYEAVTDTEGFESALRELTAELDVESVLRAGAVRHVECFEPPA